MQSRNLRIGNKYRKKVKRYLAACAVSFLLFGVVPLESWSEGNLPKIPAVMFIIAGAFLCVLFWLGAIRSQKYMMLYYYRHNKIQPVSEHIDLKAKLILMGPVIQNGINKFVGRDEIKSQ
ncbi:MAG: hypothetical protein HDQ88_05155 [Clostridia bacterium]|nr:hypothetical protein [Clostridia bacterium]